MKRNLGHVLAEMAEKERLEREAFEQRLKLIKTHVELGDMADSLQPFDPLATNGYGVEMTDEEIEDAREAGKWFWPKNGKR